MNFTRTLLFLAALAVSATASAADDAWRIVQSTGVVKAGGSGFMPAAVRPDQSLPRDSWVETGDTGRVVLVRGAETIALGPNARVQLPSQEVNGNTQVLQTLGSALYQIGKQKKPHFQVDTPYLAAVVKGTTFTVSVGEEASSVDVTEGLVEVASADGADTKYVSPGFTGIVSKNDRGTVTVVTTAHGNAKPDAAPTKSSGDKSASDDSNGKSRSVIATAIGETVIDVKDVSGGLANGLETATSNGNGNKNGLVSVSAETSDDTGKSNNSSNGNSSVASVATVDVASTNLSVDVGNGNGNSGGAAAAAVDLGASNGNGGGVSAGVDLGNSNGNGNGAGVTVDLGVGGGNGNGNGAGVGIDLDLGNGNAGNGGGNGNVGGLGLGLGNGNAGGNGKGKSS